MLDAPSLGLKPSQVDGYFRTFKQINAEGTTMRPVEHKPVGRCRLSSLASSWR